MSMGDSGRPLAACDGTLASNGSNASSICSMLRKSHEARRAGAGPDRAADGSQHSTGDTCATLKPMAGGYSIIRGSLLGGSAHAIVLYVGSCDAGEQRRG